MSSFNVLSSEITFAILMLLERRDLLSSILTCRQLRSVGLPLLDSRLYYPVGPSCHTCARSDLSPNLAEVERLRVLQVLSDDQRARRLTQLTITDHPCSHHSKGSVSGRASHEIREKALLTLAHLMPRAVKLRHVRLDILHSASIPEQLLEYSRLETLLVRLPQRLDYPVLSNLRHLALHVDQQQLPFQTLPAFSELDSLQIRFQGHPLRQHTDLINLSRYPTLRSMCVDGDTWTGFLRVFTGQSRSLEICILRGQLVVTNQLNDFFSRIASSLKYLYCHSVHLVGSVDVPLPQLQFLSLHKVLSSNRLTPFVTCPVLRTLAIDADNAPTTERQEDLNRLLQQLVLQFAGTLTTLLLRSGLSWQLSPIAIHALQRSTLLQHLMLDGCVVLDGRDWLIISYTGTLDIVAKIESWMGHRQVSGQPRNLASALKAFQNTLRLLERQQVPGMTADSARRFHVRPIMVPMTIRTCLCGFMNRMCFFKQSAIPEACFPMYDWLIADPRRNACQHSSGKDAFEHKIEVHVLRQKSPRLIPLPGVGERICSLID